MTNFTRELMFGKRPIHRTNPNYGQSEWYYLDPRGADRVADMKEIDVPGEDSPNPYADEIQNYLYKNDEYNYKQLYGNTPPPQTQSDNDQSTPSYPELRADKRNTFNSAVESFVRTSDTPQSDKSLTNQIVGAEIITQNMTQQSPVQQIVGGAMDMISEYFKMKKHRYKYLDDYHHCKANYNAAARGPHGYNTAKVLGDAKEQFDFYWNQTYKGLSEDEAQKDRFHDLGVNANGRLRGDSRLYNNAQDACAKYRTKNPEFPKKYW